MTNTLMPLTGGIKWCFFGTFMIMCLDKLFLLLFYLQGFFCADSNKNRWWALFSTWPLLVVCEGTEHCYCPLHREDATADMFRSANLTYLLKYRFSSISEPKEFFSSVHAIGRFSLCSAHSLFFSVWRDEWFKTKISKQILLLRLVVRFSCTVPEARCTMWLSDCSPVFM